MIDLRDVTKVKIFMFSGDFFDEDKEKMLELSKQYPEEISDKNLNSGNTKNINRNSNKKKSRYDEINEQADDNSTIISNDPNNLCFQNNFSEENNLLNENNLPYRICLPDKNDINSFSTVSEDTPLTKSIQSYIKENMSSYENKLTSQSKKITSLRKKTNEITREVTEKIDELDTERLEIKERVEMIDNKNVQTEGKVEEIEYKNVQIEGKVEEIENKFESFKKSENDDVEMLKKEIQALKNLLTKECLVKLINS